VPTTVTGTPIATEIAAAPRTAPATPFRIVVVGGSGGSRFLDEHVPDVVARVARRGHAVDVWHRARPGCRARSPPRTRARRAGDA
jgi:UDP-N-acetylglucosamine:LPS N-acetylglucosamine transferase